MLISDIFMAISRCSGPKEPVWAGGHHLDFGQIISQNKKGLDYWLQPPPPLQICRPSTGSSSSYCERFCFYAEDWILFCARKKERQLTDIVSTLSLADLKLGGISLTKSPLSCLSTSSMYVLIWHFAKGCNLKQLFIFF